MKRKMQKTNRINFVKALSENLDSIPRSGRLRDWCRVLERCYNKIGMKVYCHMSQQFPLHLWAQTHGELDRYNEAEYHCDVQHDIAKLNSDTHDPSGANTDPLFSRPQHSIFHNDSNDRNIKVLDIEKLKEVAAYCRNLQ